MSAITALKQSRCLTVAQTAEKRTIRTDPPSAHQPSVEHPIDIRHAPDVSLRFGSVHCLSDFTNIVICKQHRTPSKALAALFAVYPQLLGELSSPALLQLIGKGQARQSLELVSPKSHHALPEVFFAGMILPFYAYFSARFFKECCPQFGHTPTTLYP